MPRLTQLGLAVLGAALAVPGSARSGDYPPAASPSSPPVAPAVAEAPAPAPMPLDHKHFGRVARGLVPCEKCVARARATKDAQASKTAAVVQYTEPAPVAAPAKVFGRHNHAPIPTAGMPEGSRIVGCAHSSNGVCASCKVLLEMPGEVTVLAPGTPTTAVASAPGRAVATDAAPGRAMVAAGEPEPIGVMRTNYAASAPAGAMKPAQPAMPAQPGRAPYLGGEKGDPNPHVIGHLFGFSAMGRDMQDKMGEKKRKQREKHAALSYDATDGKVQELPAGMVYGPKAPR